LAAGLCPDPLWELKRSPARPPIRSEGPSSRGREEEARGGEGEEREMESVPVATIFHLYPEMIATRLLQIDRS